MIRGYGANQTKKPLYGCRVAFVFWESADGFEPSNRTLDTAFPISPG